MGKLVGKYIKKPIVEFSYFILFMIDFKEFFIGFLLTTKGTMEEKLDYTFQLYGLKELFQ
jgi:hypothetical protein